MLTTKLIYSYLFELINNKYRDAYTMCLLILQMQAVKIMYNMKFKNFPAKFSWTNNKPIYYYVCPL